jgi:aldose 1-epimerase
MLERDDEGIATSRRVTPPDGPWDDCFGDVAQPVRLNWPGVLTLDIEASCDYFVVYDEPEHALCIEPQTAPPDTLNHDPVRVVPGQPLVATTTWRWAVERGNS